MKKSIRIRKKVYFVVIILTILVTGSYIIFSRAIASEFTFNITQFKDDILDDPDDCWKKPGDNRKNAMCNKLTELQELIDLENFEEAYDKLLYDIKPKLTGLKTDELEQSWGNGVYDQVWVLCESLREEYRIACNLILAEINPQSVYDDDKTPPDIVITYAGVQHISAPGEWTVEVGDLESGLDSVIIEVNDIVEINDINLIDIYTITYVISVPAIEGINTIVVTATNNDKDFVGDQETSTESEWVEIYATPIIDHPDDIQYNRLSTGYTITWTAIDDNPDTYLVKVDYEWIYEIGEWESGMPITINIDGLFIGTYKFMIYVYDTDGNFAEDLVIVNVVQGISLPIIEIVYKGDKTTENPGYWDVHIEDYLSGIKGFKISIDGETYEEQYQPDPPYGLVYVGVTGIPVPRTAGIHFIGVDVLNGADILLVTQKQVNIKPVDDTPPGLFIRYDGSYIVNDPGEWSVYVWDEESGIGEVHITLNVNGEMYDEIQENLNGIESHVYEIPIPAIEGIYTVHALVKNDITYDGVQETSEAEQSVEIGPYVPPVPGPVDDTAPIIFIQYDGTQTVHNPGQWTIYIYDEESGLGEIHITLSFGGEIYYEIQENLNGQESKLYEVPIQAVEGWHFLNVLVTNDITYDGVQETNSIIDEPIEIEPYEPPIPS